MSILKTIKQIADEIGVSKQAVQQKIKKEPLSASLRNLSATVGGATCYDVVGESLIKSAFCKKGEAGTPTSLPTSKQGELVDTTSVLISTLQSQVEALTAEVKILQQQLDGERQHNRKQCERIFPLIEQAQKLAENAQTLQAREFIAPQLTDGKRKWQFWKR